MKYAKLKVRLTGITPILGSIAMNKEVFRDYIATNCVTDEERERAAEDVDNVKEGETEEEKAVICKSTGFYRDENDYPILKGYQIKGFFKEAARALKDQIGLTNHVSKVDNYIFILEQNIPLYRMDGTRVKKYDYISSRPLRGMTAQGPRISIAVSETIEEYYMDLTIKILFNKKTAKSKELDAAVVKELLDYGELKGLLQWRNGGYGSFTWELLGEEEVE